MATLQELPTEILSHVFAYLANDKQLLRNLALQCHCFSLSVRPILLRHVDLSPNGGGSSLKLELLNRTLCDSPLLSSMVRSLALSWSDCSLKLYEVIQSLLGRLTALRFLKVSNNSSHHSFKHSLLDVNRMDQLAEVRLNDMCLTVEDMARYFFLDKISHLTVLWLRAQISPSFDPGWSDVEWSLRTLPRRESHGSSPVINIDFGPIFHLPEPVMKEILSWPKSLKRLRCNITGWDSPSRFGASKHLMTTLSPESVARALSPTKHSLRDLELMDNGCQWPGHDKTQMDLSDFAFLTRLHVPSTCFFENLTHGVKRGGMYALLPPSLVELRIMYDLGDCIRPNEEESGPVPSPSFNVESFIDLELLSLGNPRDLKWLMELAENKKECFPGLRRVALIERCGILRAGVHPTNWKLPSTIAEAFEGAGIQFRAVVRTTSAVPTFE